MPVPEEISRYCSSLVSIVTRDDGRGRKTKKELQLAHFSVQEYLRSIYFEENGARESIADLCLAYLLELDHSLSAERLREIYPFAKYSARYWTAHAQVAERNTKQTSAISKEFFLCKEAYASCGRLFCLDRPWDDTDLDRKQIPPYIMPP
jgi:hypothetical protein